MSARLAGPCWRRSREESADLAGRLEQLGEFGIIGLFRQRASPRRRWVVAGIGDDCAVLDAGGSERLLVTTDMLVERVHFLREGITPAQLGWKSLAVNLSDIAAMGGEPTAAFLALGLTNDLDPCCV
jgi:thiamine-monophosphate kinase